MGRLIKRWLPDGPYLAGQRWCPRQNPVARLNHPRRTAANTRLALSTTAAIGAPYRSLGRSGSAALRDLHLQFGCSLGTKHLAYVDRKISS